MVGVYKCMCDGLELDAADGRRADDDGCDANEANAPGRAKESEEVALHAIFGSNKVQVFIDSIICDLTQTVSN